MYSRVQFIVPLSVALLVLLVSGIFFFDIWSTSVSYAQLLQPDTEDELLSLNAQSSGDCPCGNERK